MAQVKSFFPKLNPLFMGWSVGTLGVSVLLNTQNAAALFFFINVLSIEPWVAGVILTGSKIYDSVTDPLMGNISDRTNSRWGRRRPYLLTGGLACGFCFALLFAPPQLSSETATIVYATCILLLLATAYTVFNVPYLAMPTEMVEDYHDRSRLMSYRVVWISIGTFIATAVYPAFLGFLQDSMGFESRAAFALLGVVWGVVISVGMVAAFFGTRNAKFTQQVRVDLPFSERLKSAMENRPFILLLGIKLSGLLAFAAILASKFFFATVVMLKGVQIVAIFGSMQLVGQITTLPMWLAYSKRVGKRKVVMVATAAMILFTLTWFMSGPDESLWIYGLRGLLLGIGASGTQLGVNSMLPDVIEYDYRRTGLRREGIYAGFISFTEKLAFTLSAVILGSFLSYMGFIKGAAPADQPASAGFAIMMCIAVLPIGLYIIKMVLLCFYDLDAEKLKAARPPKRAEEIA
jgi:GPH family glycoside/pentoside/hexuronide:cation symporter